MPDESYAHHLLSRVAQHARNLGVAFSFKLNPRDSSSYNPRGDEDFTIMLGDKIVRVVGVGYRRDSVASGRGVIFEVKLPVRVGRTRASDWYSLRKSTVEGLPDYRRFDEVVRLDREDKFHPQKRDVSRLFEWLTFALTWYKNVHDEDIAQSKSTDSCIKRVKAVAVALGTVMPSHYIQALAQENSINFGTSVGGQHSLDAPYAKIEANSHGSVKLTIDRKSCQPINPEHAEMVRKAYEALIA